MENAYMNVTHAVDMNWIVITYIMENIEQWLTVALILFFVGINMYELFFFLKQPLYELMKHM